MKKTPTVILLAVAHLVAMAQGVPQRTYDVVAAGMTAGTYMAARPSTDGQALFSIVPRKVTPFAQQAVSQTRAEGSVTAAPYFNVRMALPIPSCYTPTEQGVKAGLDWGVYAHLHSGALEVCPNGDLLAVYFSTPIGKAEADTAATTSRHSFSLTTTRCGSLAEDAT